MEGTIRKAIHSVLQELGISGVDFVVEHPAELSHGDYATNVAMAAAKKLGKNPRDIAGAFRSTLQGKIPNVESVEIAGPGFLNFTLTRNFFTEKIAEANDLGENWGRNGSWKGKKVLVEYTDPNPFKEFHVGHLFTNSVGESIARLFIYNGADVKRINYGSDVGLHVAHALWGMQELGMSAESEFTARDLGRAYAHGATAYKNEDPRAVREIRDINKKVYERSDEAMNTLYDKGKAVSVEYFQDIYNMLDSKFDVQFFESDVAGPGKELVIAHPEIFPESEGARIFKGEEHGLHTRVFINKEGLPTYEAKELALAKLKEEQIGTYDWSVISTGNEITEYFKVIKKAMSLLYPELAEKTEHIGHGTVRLATGKMSSRTGDVVPAVEFIDEVADAAAAKMDEGGKTAPDPELARIIALGAIKYTTLRGHITQDSIFDKEKALSFEGDSGPYLQYTHARIGSLEEKSAQVGVQPQTDKKPDTPYLIERLLYRFPEIIEEGLRDRAPHKVTVFLTELAGAFNTFYGEEKVADPEDAYAPYKLALSRAVKQTLRNGLWVLGIKAPERM